jgi:hypothetical protein
MVAGISVHGLLTPLLMGLWKGKLHGREPEVEQNCSLPGGQEAKRKRKEWGPIALKGHTPK